MPKLKATGNFGDLKSKVNVLSNVKVIQKNQNCGKLAQTCGELKISFSKFPYKFKILSGLCHFVTAVEVQCIYVLLDFCSVKCEKKNTHAVVILYVGIKWCHLVKMKVANTFHFFLIVDMTLSFGHWCRGAMYLHSYRFLLSQN